MIPDQDPKIVAAYLLREVFTICRAKSNIPLDEWKSLKKEIESFLNGYLPDVSLYKKVRFVTKYKDERPYNNIIAENIALQREIENLKIHIRIYQQREADIYKVLRRSLKKDFNDLKKEALE